MPFAAAVLMLLGAPECPAAVPPAAVFDARGLSWETRCTVEVLQGLANRQGPRLYLDFGQTWSRQWMDIYAERNGITFEPVGSLRELLTRFRGSYSGLVAYDPAVDGSRYVAIALAGAEGLLPVAPALLDGSSQELLGSSTAWPGVDFTSDDATTTTAWNRGGGAAFEGVPGEGAWLYEKPTAKPSDWTMVTLGPLSVDLDRYPVLEAEVSRLSGAGARWGLKLTWDRNADGQVMGAEDDLNLDFPTEPGTWRWNVAQMAGLSGRQGFSHIQLHVAGPGARALFRRVRFVSASGEAAPAQPAVPLAELLQTPVVHDLRGRFTDSVAAYDWALQNVMPNCDRRFAHAVNGRVEGILAGCGPFPGFDWTAQRKAFVFNLSCSAKEVQSYGDSRVGGSPRQAECYERIVAALEPPAMVTGYGEPELDWCDLLSRYGHYSFHAYDNWSFHSQVPPRAPLLRQRSAYRPENTTCDPSKVYVCVMTSEGDTMKGPIPFFYGSWWDRARGTVPMNWGVNPLMGRYFPAMLEYFYDTASLNDYFFVGCSGAGYVYPDKLPNLAQFARHTADMCRESDLVVIDAWGAGRKDVQETYTDITRPLGFTVNQSPARMEVLPNGTPVAYHQLAYWQTPATGGAGNWASIFRDDARRAEAIDWVAKRIEAIAGDHYPPFIILVYGDLHSWDRHAQVAAEIAAKLDPARFKVARLDEAFAAWRQWAAGRVLVGSHDVTERMVWAVLEGTPTQLPVTLSNVSDAPVTAHLTARIGDQEASREVALGPCQTTQVTDYVPPVPGPGWPDRATLSVRSAGDPVDREVLLTTVPRPAGFSAPQVSLAAVWQSLRLNHEKGAEIADPDALWGHAWATPPAGSGWSCVQYGPYADMPAGKYLIAFRVRLADPAAAPRGKRLGVIDVFAGGYDGTAEVAAEHVLKAEDFADATGEPGDQYVWLTLEADWPGSPSLMETRLAWDGEAPMVIDRVVAFRVP